MDDIEEILTARANTHGEFRDVCRIAIQIIRTVQSAPNWESMSEIQQMALIMIAMKIGRIGSGDSGEVDHWRDIAGYAKLVSDRLI